MTSTVGIKRKQENSCEDNLKNYKKRKTEPSDDDYKTPKICHVNGLPIGGFDKYLKRTDFKYLKELFYKGKEPEINKEILVHIEEFEKKESLKLPDDLRTFFTLKRIRGITFGCYPTNNSLCIPEEKFFSDKDSPKFHLKLCSGKDLKMGLPTDYLLKIMNENQGCFYWYAGWNGKESKECKIYCAREELDIDSNPKKNLFLSSESLSKFFISYYLIGSVYYFHNGKVGKNDKFFIKEIKKIQQIKFY